MDRCAHPHDVVFMLLVTNQLGLRSSLGFETIKTFVYQKYTQLSAEKKFFSKIFKPTISPNMLYQHIFANVMWGLLAMAQYAKILMNA